MDSETLVAFRPVKELFQASPTIFEFRRRLDLHGISSRRHGEFAEEFHLGHRAETDLPMRRDPSPRHTLSCSLFHPPTRRYPVADGSYSKRQSSNEPASEGRNEGLRPR